MRNRKRGAGGFTLVELIVVIAILAILAGVGTVAYSGYVKKANKTVDQQLVGELVYACSLADYANPGMMDNRTAMIVLTDNAAPRFTIGTADENAAFQAAIEDAMGDMSNTTLRYDWGADVPTMQGILTSLGDETTIDGKVDGGTGLGTALTYKTTDGRTATVSYADNADFMWQEALRAAGAAEDLTGRDDGILLTHLAKGTTGQYDPADINEKGEQISDETYSRYAAARVAESWSTVDESGMVGSDLGFICNMVARNYAFAEYLKSNGYDVADSDIEALQTWEHALDASIGDFVQMALLSTEEGLGANDMVEFFAYYDEANDEFIPYFTEDSLTAMIQAAQAYITPIYSADGDEPRYSQAYIDGLGYYTLMYNIDQVSGEDKLYDPTADDYFESLSPYVTLAGQICSGRMDTTALDSALTTLKEAGANNAVIILYTKANGAAFVSTTPADAWTGNQ